MNFKLNKRAIFSTLVIIIIMIQIYYIHFLRQEIHTQVSAYQMVIDQMEVDFEEEINAHKITIEHLHQDNLNLNKEKESLEKEVDELKRVIKIIADNLKVNKKELISDPKTVSRKGGDAKTDWMTFEMTHYTAFCNGCIGITKQGLDVRNTIYHNGMRIIAVDPKVIKLNSIVEVRRSDGSTFKAIASDTGGRIKGSIIDLLVQDTETAVRKGRQKVKLRVLKWGE